MDASQVASLMNLDTVRMLLKVELGYSVTSDLVEVQDLGVVNQVFIATVIQESFKHQKLVLRTGSNLEHYQREKRCLDQVAVFCKEEIPAPMVLHIGEYQGQAYMIESYLEGANGQELLQDYNDKQGEIIFNEIWRQLGSYLAILHRLKVDGFGEPLVHYPTTTSSGKEGQSSSSSACSVDHSTPLRGQSRFERFVEYNIGELAKGGAEDGGDPLQRPPLSVLTSKLAQRIIEVFRDLLHQHQNGAFQFGLCHGDVSLKNCLVQLLLPIHDQSVTTSTREYNHIKDWTKVVRTSLIDWGCATIDIVPHAEFNAVDIAPQYLDSLLIGYGITRDEYEKGKTKRAQLRMLRTLDTLRWAIDRGHTLTSYISNFISALHACGIE